MGRRCLYATHAEKVAAKRERAKLMTTLKVGKSQHVRWKAIKTCYKLGSDDATATLLLDCFLSLNKFEPVVDVPLAADPTTVEDDKSLILPIFENMPLKVKQEEILEPPVPDFTAMVASTGDSASRPVSSAAKGVPPLDMSCDMIYKVTVVLNLESDWKHPVVVSLSNATVASSEVTGSTCHKVKVINDQTLEVTSVTENVGDGHDEMAPMSDEPHVAMTDPFFVVSTENVGDSHAGMMTTDSVFDVSSECEDPSECDDTPSECSDADVKDDNRSLISGWKDDPNNDPDWDPEDNSDDEVVVRKKKRAAPKKSGSDSGSSSDSDSDSEDTVACHACSFHTPSPAILTSHVMKKHYEEASMKGQRMCRQCGKVEDSIEALQQHRQANHNDDVETQRKCPLCHEVFTSYYKYRTHVTAHEHKHKCQKCKRLFLTPQSLRRHIGSLHRTFPPQVKHLKLVCEICGHLERQQNKLEEHQTIKHGIDFGKRLSCSECDEVFQSNKQLRTHIRWHHQLLRPLECEVCGRTFKQAASLRGHVENVHLQTNMQACPHCEKKFTTRGHLKKHINTVHLKLRHLPCPWPGCARSFGSKWHLRVHMHIHNNEKPLACPHCDFRARQRHSLDYHLDRHHRDLVPEQKKNKVTGNNGQVTTEAAANEQVSSEETTTTGTTTHSDPVMAEHTSNENNGEVTETDTVDD